MPAEQRRTELSSGPMHAKARPPGGAQEAVFHHPGYLVNNEGTLPVRVWAQAAGATVHVTRGYYTEDTVLQLVHNFEPAAVIVAAGEGLAGAMSTVAFPDLRFNAGDIIWLNVITHGGARDVVVQVLLAVASTVAPPYPEGTS